MMEFFESLEQIRIGNLTLMALLSTAFLFFVCVIIRKIVMTLFGHAMGRSRIDGSVKHFLTSALGALLWIVIVLIVVDHLGIPMTGLVAIVSVASLALSLSVQNILTNIFSGMTLLGTRPFGAGDYVDIGGTQGNIRKVGLFYTTLQTLDGRTIHFPNSKVTDSKLENYSTNVIRRIDLTVTAAYDDSTVAVKKALHEAVEMTDGVLTDPEPVIGALSYGESSISYALYAWVHNEDYFKVKFALTENVRLAFETNGVQMTYNHLNVHIVEK